MIAYMLLCFYTVSPSRSLLNVTQDIFLSIRYLDGKWSLLPLMGDYQFFQMFAYVEVIRIKTLLLEMPGLPAIPI
jgi:hypothetical protein